MGIESAVDAAKHDHLGCRLGNVHLEFEEESIQLSLREWVGALVLHGVLRCNHQKAVAERAALSVGGDLALFHRLEERRLGLRRRPVDLVRKQGVGEDRPFAELERPRVLAVDAGPDNVGREQVGGELDSGEAGIERRRERPRHQRLRGARHSLQEHMPATEDGDVQPVDDLELADHRATHGLVQYRAQCGGVALACHGGHCACHLTAAPVHWRSQASTSRARRSSWLSSGRPDASERAWASNAASA